MGFHSCTVTSICCLYQWAICQGPHSQCFQVSAPIRHTKHVSFRLCSCPNFWIRIFTILQIRQRVPSNERSDDRVANNEDGSAGWWEHGKARYPLLGLLKYCSEPEDRPLPRLALRSQANIKQEAIRGIYFRAVLKILSLSEPTWFYVATTLSIFLGKRYMAIFRIIANAFH